MRASGHAPLLGLLLLGLVLLGLLLLPAFLRPALAEPYLAVAQGMKCGACHVNTTGGGMRNEYGNAYSQMQLAARQLATADADRWSGRLSRHVGVGGNLRASAAHVDVPNQPEQAFLAVDDARLYLDFSPLPGRLNIHLDQRMAPGSSINREAYARYRSAVGNWQVKAGRMYLPYGLRLQDDSAFIRSVPGINFNTPDTGIELGWETARWSAQLAVSNGSGGGPETDTGKQASLRAEHVRPDWRAGASVNFNDTAAGNRHMQNIFAGLRTGRIAWLAEIDHIRDDSGATGTITQYVGLLEANWMYRQGHNLKITAEYLDPDRDVGGNRRQRLSAVWEYFPFEHAQLRAGLREYDSATANDVHDRTELFIQVHGHF